MPDAELDTVVDDNAQDDAGRAENEPTNADGKQSAEGANPDDSHAAPLVVVTDDDGKVLKSYATGDDAAKAIREQEKFYGKQIGQLQRQLNEIQTGTRLEKLEAQSKAAEAAAQLKRDEAELAKLKEDIADNPEKAVDLLLQRDQYFQQRLADMEANIKTELEDRFTKQSDDYKANAPLIEAMVERGMKRSDAIELAKEHVRPAQPKSAPRPVPSGQSAKRGTGAPKEEAPVRSAQEEALIDAMQLRQYVKS